MHTNFLDALDEKIKFAEEKYNEARQNAISELEPNIRIHNDFGAAYATKIDQVTRYASEIKILYEVKQMYEYFNSKEK